MGFLLEKLCILESTRQVEVGIDVSATTADVDRGYTSKAGSLSNIRVIPGVTIDPASEAAETRLHIGSCDEAEFDKRLGRSPKNTDRKALSHVTRSLDWKWSANDDAMSFLSSPLTTTEPCFAVDLSWRDDSC